jgi:predicted enzyme related to lactoylglutathione lyase
MEKIIAWVEIPTENFERAVKFYSEVFNWEISSHDFGIEKMAMLPHDSGAIISAKGYKPSKHGILVSFHCTTTLEEVLQRVLKSQGSILVPKTKIEAPDRDYFAVILDSEGNRIGIYGK